MRVAGFNLDIGSALLFGSGIVLLVWAILKAIGVINTPPLILAIPYFAGAAGVIGIAVVLSKLLVNLGKVLEKIVGLEKDMGIVKSDIRGLETDIMSVKWGVRVLENDMGLVKRKLRLA